MADETPQNPNKSPTQMPMTGAWQDVGAEFRLPGFALIGAAWLAAAAVCAVGWVIFNSLKPVGAPAAWRAWFPVAGAFLIGVLAMRPWKIRRLGRLPMLWLMGRGISFLSVLALAALLYSAPHPRPDPLSYGLVLAGAYFAALMAESVVMARRLRAPTG